MKTFYSILLVLLVSVTMTAQVNVTFSVDMSEVDEVSGNGVHLAGEFQGWNEAGTPLTDQGNGTWSVTLSLPVGAHEFKFINGNDWPFEELVPNACRANLAGNTNRRLVINEGASNVTYAVCFSSCAACGDLAVLFRVDMSLEEEVAPQGVHVAGNFQGPVWDPGAVTMNSEDGIVFTRLVTFNPSVLNGGALEFKYINGNNWNFPNENVSGDCGQGGNRVLTLEDNNTVTDLYCFNQCGTCVAPVLVTFTVDMSNEEVSSNGVHIAGSFQNWQSGDTPLTLVGDGIYEVVLPLQPGTYEYKFLNGNNWGSDESVPSACASNNNRSVTVDESENQVYQNCFGQCAEFCTANPDPADITFSVNAADITVSASGLWLMGNFTSPAWQGGAIELTDVDGSGIYTATVIVDGAAEFQYKFTNGDPFPDGAIDALVEETYDFTVGGCGVPNGIGGFNRIHVRSGAPEMLSVVCYNSCVDCGENVANLKNPFGVKLFPNPVNEQLSLSTTQFDGWAEVNVLDLSGRVVVSTSLNFAGGAQNRLNVSRLLTGMYVVQIIADNKRSTLSFIKQ